MEFKWNKYSTFTDSAIHTHSNSPKYFKKRTFYDASIKSASSVYLHKNLPPQTGSRIPWWTKPPVVESFQPWHRSFGSNDTPFHLVPVALGEKKHRKASGHFFVGKTCVGSLLFLYLEWSDSGISTKCRLSELARFWNSAFFNPIGSIDDGIFTSICAWLLVNACKQIYRSSVLPMDPLGMNLQTSSFCLPTLLSDSVSLSTRSPFCAWCRLDLATAETSEWLLNMIFNLDLLQY